MRLKSIDYTEFENDPREWKITGLEFGDINLIVGINSSGKTRALQLINSLSHLLVRGIVTTMTPTFKYDARFREGIEKIIYKPERNPIA